MTKEQVERGQHILNEIKNTSDNIEQLHQQIEFKKKKKK